MKKLAILLSLSISSSFALNINEVVNSAYLKNQDLQSLEKSIDLASQNIKLATKWKDPVLSFGVNDISFDDPFKRDIEPMQSSFIGISQVIPIGKKLQIQKSIAQKDKSIAKLILEDKKLLLKAKIYEASYSILFLEKKLKLLNSYEKNIKKISSLSTQLYKFGKASQNEVLSSSISLVDLKIKKQKLQNIIDNLYLKLEQISYMKISRINTNKKFEKLVLNVNTKEHPKIKMQDIQSKKYLDISSLEKENEKQDIKVNVSYFNRHSKYDDYANISVNIPLSVNNTQKVKAIKAKIQANKTDLRTKDLIKQFEIQTKVLQNNANSAFKNYNLIKKQLVPLKQKMQKNLENYNSFDLVKPQMIIKNLNELISYEIKALNEKMKYFTNYAKSKYYVLKVK